MHKNTISDAVSKSVDDLLSKPMFAHNYRTEPAFRAALDHLRWSVGAKFGGDHPIVDNTMDDIDDEAPVRTVAVIRTDVPMQWSKTARRIMLDGVEHYLVDGREMQFEDEEKLASIALDNALGVGEVPERMARYAAARGQTVDEVLADPSILNPDPLDVHFAPHADLESLIAAAVPDGTVISRASAGGELGWRVGQGWLPVECAASSSEDVLRDFARSLVAIPAPIMKTNGKDHSIGAAADGRYRFEEGVVEVLS